MRMDTAASVIVVVIIIGAFGFVGAMRRRQQMKNWEQGNLTDIAGQKGSFKKELGEFKHPAKKENRDFLRRVK